MKCCCKLEHSSSVLGNSSSSFSLSSLTAYFWSPSWLPLLYESESPLNFASKNRNNFNWSLTGERLVVNYFRSHFSLWSMRSPFSAPPSSLDHCWRRFWHPVGSSFGFSSLWHVDFGTKPVVMETKLIFTCILNRSKYYYLFRTYLNDAQTESSLFGQILSHFATWFRWHIERCLERTALLCIQYGARTLRATAAIDFRWKYIFGIIIVWACKGETRNMISRTMAIQFTYHWNLLAFRLLFHNRFDRTVDSVSPHIVRLSSIVRHKRRT